MGPRPLSDLLVVALEQAVAAPYCTTRLADAGARVIKIEREEGDLARGYDSVALGESAFFVWLNRGKESIRLDIKDPADARLLDTLLSRADIYVQNLAPGAAARAGFGSADLRRRHPRLITCDISGYGDSGPYADMKAYDLLIQCEAGLAAVTGSEAEPGRVGVSIADLACGANAHAAILQALYARERAGQGQSISVSLFDGVAEWMALPLLYQDYAGKAPGRTGLRHAAIAPYGPYRAGDGGQVVIAVQSEREWQAFCTGVLSDPALAADPRFSSNARRCDNRAAMDGHIDAALATLSAEALIARLRDARVAFGALNTVEGLSRHPQLRRVEVMTPGGAVRVPAPPFRTDDETQPLGPVPALDQHGAAIRREFTGHPPADLANGQEGPSP